MLKSQYGVTHGSANRLALIAREADAASITRVAKAAGSDPIDDMYSGKKAGLKPLYDALITTITSFGNDIEVAPKKGYVSLRRKKQFAMLQPTTASRIDVGVILKDAPTTERLESGLGLNAMFTHRVRVNDINDSFMKALKIKSTCSKCWINLAETYGAIHLRSEIPKLLREAPISNAKPDTILICQAEALINMHYYEDATLAFSQILDLNPHNVSIIIKRGQTYHKRRRYGEALVDFNQALKLKPQEAKAILGRGQVYCQTKNYKEALKDFDLVIKLDPNLEHEGQEEKAILLYSLLRYQDAVLAYSRALKVHPTCLNCWIGLARIYEKLYTRRDIPKLLREVPFENDDKAFIIATRAEALRKMGYYEEARSAFNSAFTLDSSIRLSFEDGQGLVFSYLGQYAEAIECYKKSLKYYPMNHRALYNIAVAMFRWKGQVDAQTHIDAAHNALLAKLQTINRGDALYGLAGLTALTGNANQALGYLQRAIPFAEYTADWAKHDIAWLDLHSNLWFQSLIFREEQTKEGKGVYQPAIEDYYHAITLVSSDIGTAHNGEVTNSALIKYQQVTEDDPFLLQNNSSLLPEKSLEPPSMLISVASSSLSVPRLNYEQGLSLLRELIPATDIDTLSGFSTLDLRLLAAVEVLAQRAKEGQSLPRSVGIPRARARLPESLAPNRLELVYRHGRLEALG